MKKHFINNSGAHNLILILLNYKIKVICFLIYFLGTSGPGTITDLINMLRNLLLATPFSFLNFKIKCLKLSYNNNWPHLKTVAPTPGLSSGSLRRKSGNFTRVVLVKRTRSL